MLYEQDRYRSSRELAQHYEDTKVRNPPGTGTIATGQQSLPTVLKVLVGWRDMQSGHNAVGVDYVLLTLLWSARRGEGSKVRRYESCSPEELSLQLVSWAWLSPKPTAKNPTTGLRGSQVFFHDTKNGQFQLLPVAYFAERILRWRLDDSRLKERKVADELAQARRTKDKDRIAELERQQRNLERWLSPCRRLIQ